MKPSFRATVLRLIPILLVTVGAAAWFADVQQGGPYVIRNLIPLLVLLLLAALTLHQGGGTWSGQGMRMPLGTAGFAVPALGLSAYLHFAYAANLGGLFDDARYPMEVFRFLPIYTLFAGGIGFAIGWIIGRNL